MKKQISYPIRLEIKKDYLLLSAVEFELIQTVGKLNAIHRKDQITPLQLYKTFFNFFSELMDCYQSARSQKKMKTLSIGEASRKMGVSVKVVRTLIDQKVIDAYRTPSGHRKPNEASVEAWITQQTLKGNL